MLKRPLALALSVALGSAILAGCGQPATETDTASASKEPETRQAPPAAEKPAKHRSLKEVLAARPEQDKQRDEYRNPAETIAFFRIEPGMTVAETLPGGGWYTRILADYLGENGALYGVNYVDDMWERFGFFDDDAIKERVAATKGFNNMVDGFTENGIKTRGFTFGTVPEEVKGTVDRVLFIRALHNLNRFESQAESLTQALQATRAMLKEDGLVGVVQHRIPEDAAGDDGSRGYLKESRVKAAFEQAGFELVASSEVNANENDQPGPEDIVWRLPPLYFGAGENEEQRQAMTEIGESDRMTMLFKLADTQ